MPLKYDKPRILLIDTPTDCDTVLQDAGYNVSVGTFGTPYKVDQSGDLALVYLNEELPHLEEQEIVIVNTDCTDALPVPQDLRPAIGVKQIWQKADFGQIDPRPFVMAGCQRIFDRIHQFGGLMIVLISGQYRKKFTYGVRTAGAGLYEAGADTFSNWGFSSGLSGFRSLDRKGSEIIILPEANALGRLISRGMKDAYFTCAFHPRYNSPDCGRPIANNQFGECVAGLYRYTDPERFLLVLPQMPNLSSILAELMSEWCSQWCPKLFPHLEGANWLYSPRYEQPEITSLRSEIDEVKSKFEVRIADLGKQINTHRDQNPDWYTLLNGTGADLVGAVIRALQQLGFTDVVDVDEESKGTGDTRNLREDIQIKDTFPVLIVDVKGLTGGPEDSDATQSEKHALMRSEEFNGRVKPLTIINHERNLPPHERNPNPYREEIIRNALQTKLGLMTTWDLFQLLRNKLSLGWRDDAVKPVFYRTGRIEPIPEHYKLIGNIVHVWEHSVGVVPNQELHQGDTIALKVEDLFQEFHIESLRVNDASVDTAIADSKCGIRLSPHEAVFREKMPLYFVTPASS